MATMNPFAGNPAFSLASLTEAINVLPNNYGRINQLGLFRTKGITTRTAMIERKNGVLTLLPTRPVGSPGTMGRQGKRDLRSFVIPHIPHDDGVQPDEVQGVRSFGSENATDPVISVVNDKLETMRNNHAITLEFMRMGALKGFVLDGEGTLLYNYFTEFGVTQEEVDFELSTTGTDVRKKCAEVLRLMEDSLLGETMNGVHALVSPEFFDALVAHPRVEEAYKFYQQQQNLSGDFRKGFMFGGITFEEYRGKAAGLDANNAPFVYEFVPADQGIAFPLGTQQTFVNYFAPADFNETVNTVGLPYYAKIMERDFGRGYQLHTQSNPLPIVTRPKLIIKLNKDS